MHEIYRAATFGNYEMVKFFLEFNVDPSITNRYGWTPLHGAAANGHLECVKLLLDRGAQSSPIFDTGKTPLDFVRSSKAHYDWVTLGQDSGHYLHGELFRARKEGPLETERRNTIEDMLLRRDALTGEQLYDTDPGGLTQKMHERFSFWYYSFQRNGSGVLSDSE